LPRDCQQPHLPPNPILNHSAASEAATKPDVTADERRWTQIARTKDKGPGIRNQERGDGHPQITQIPQIGPEFKTPVF
jgi:hypothetical protein